MTTNKLLNEKWIRDFYTELGVPCSDAHAIDWVLSHWDSLATSEREVTASMLTDINAIIATVSTGKHRTYRQARDNVLLYLAQACQWKLPEKKVQVLRDSDLQWFDLLNQQAQFAQSLLSLYSKAKTHFLRHRPAITPAWTAIVFAVEVAPISIANLTAILNSPQQIEEFQSHLTIRINQLTPLSSGQDEPEFTRYALSPFAYRILVQYHAIQGAPISPTQLVQQLNQWITQTPYSLPSRSAPQWHHIFQAVWHYRDDLPPTLLKDMAFMSRHVAFTLNPPTPAQIRRTLPHIYAQDWDKSWFDGLIPSTKKVVWPHLTLLQQYKYHGKKASDSLSVPSWDANNVLPVLFYHYTNDLITYGGVNKPVLSLGTIRKYTGIYKVLIAQPLSYVEATEPSRLMAWAHQAYNTLDSDTHREMLHYFFRSLRHHPLTDHFDLSAFSPPTLPQLVDAFRLNVGELNNIIHILLTQPGATPLQSLFSCIAAILGFFAMLRRGEILRLRMQDIHVQSEHKQLFRFTITNTLEGDTKNKRSRTVYTVIPEELAYLLRIALHIKKSCPPDTPFLGFEGEKMSSRQLHYLLPVTRTLKACLGPLVRIHHLRHSGAHLFYLQGMTLLYDVQPSDLSIDAHTQRLLNQAVCQARFDYWLEGRDFTLMNDNLIFDVMGKQLGHAHYATTRRSYLHGAEWLKAIIQPGNRAYSHSELRYILGLSPTSNDISRQLSRLSPDYAALTLEQKKQHPIMLSEQTLIDSILKRSHSVHTDIANYDEAQLSYYGVWQQQVLTQNNAFLGQQTLDMLKKKHINFSTLSDLWQQSGRHQHRPLSKSQLTALKTLRNTAKISIQNNENVTLTLACNKKNAAVFTTLIRQPEWQWLSIAFILHHNRKIDVSRQLAILQQQFARQGERITQKKIATGTSQLVICLSPKQIADIRLMQQLLQYFQLESTQSTLTPIKDHL